MEVILILIAIAVAIEIAFQVRLRVGKSKAMGHLRASWGNPPDRAYEPGEMGSIQADAATYYSRGDWRIDNTTWNDLEMEALYRRVNASQTQIGDAALYATLRDPVDDPEKLKPRRQLMRWAQDNPAAREEARYALGSAGRRRRADLPSLFGRELTKSYRGPLCRALAIAFAAALALALCGVVAVYVPIGFGIVNMLLSRYLHTKYERDVESVLYLLALSGAANRLRKLDMTSAGAYAEQLKALARSYAGLNDHGFLDLFFEVDALLIVFNGIFLTEPIAYEWFARRVERQKEGLRETILLLGKIDASLAVASYRAGLETYCEPELNQSEPRSLEGVGIVHPLVRNAVPNDIRCNEHILLTGSNASGKSTFIKAIALNAILAQSIATCTATSYRACCFRVATSMAVRDNIQGEESYFVVEVRALKRLLSDETDLPNLYAIDEVLKGTNTKERIAASAAYLRYLAGRNCVCLAATHDIELTYLLEGVYRNLHFTETFEEGEMRFDYRLRIGRSTSRNAIALMDAMGFPNALVKEARELANDARSYPSPDLG